MPAAIQEQGDNVSNLLYEAAVASWENRPGAVVELHPSFSGVRALRPDYKPVDCYESMGSDGIGTKVEISERTKIHSGTARDLFAMACDDAVVRGAEPIAINTILDVNKLLENDLLTNEAVRQMALGYIAAAQAANVVILNGETAILGDRVGGYGPFNYNWCATVLWYAQRDRILSGQEVQAGDTLIGLAEPGFRSNGITKVRETMLQHYGPEWHTEVVPELGSDTLGELVRQPSIIFSRFVTSLTGGFDINQEPKAKITGAAHITGGGQPGKLGRMLQPTGLGAHIDNPIPPPEIMLEVQRLSGLSDADAYGQWHMGPGMILATPEPDKVLAEAEAQHITAQRIGCVDGGYGIVLKNRGAQRRMPWLVFPPLKRSADDPKSPAARSI